jgi:ubiquinone/menaquinone biosynthesis C-methylase UbiE
LTAGQRFARLATDVTVRWPRLWPLFRPVIRWQFERLAPVWDQTLSPDGDRLLDEALARVPEASLALDVGTGTGRGAEAIVDRFPDARVTGVDVSPGMIEEARRRVPGASFELGDASNLPFDDGSFDLVTHTNMIPFLDQVTRVLRPGGWTLFVYTNGADTPIYVRPELLRQELERRGFTEFADVAVGRGTAVLARRGEPV